MPYDQYVPWKRKVEWVSAVAEVQLQVNKSEQVEGEHVEGGQR